MYVRHFVIISVWMYQFLTLFPVIYVVERTMVVVMGVMSNNQSIIIHIISLSSCLSTIPSDICRDRHLSHTSVLSFRPRVNESSTITLHEASCNSFIHGHAVKRLLDTRKLHHRGLDTGDRVSPVPLRAEALAARTGSLVWWLLLPVILVAGACRGQRLEI